MNGNVLFGRNGLQVDTKVLLSDSSLPPIVRIFLEALVNYGAFLVDGGGGFGFAAEDIHTADYSRIVGNDVDAHVRTLTNLDDLDPTKTYWQIIIETLNDHLSGWSPTGQATTLLGGSGLAFAYCDPTRGFRSNFSVTSNLSSE